jgi:alcohol dehydrogenase class IV
LFDLAQDIGAPTTLAAVGMKEADLDRVADLAVARPYPNPAPLERNLVRALLETAYHSRRSAP